MEEALSIASKIVELSAEMSSFKTELIRLDAEIITDKDRKQEEQTRRIFESMVEDFHQRILKLENERQLAEDRKNYGIYHKDKVAIMDLQKEQELIARSKERMDMMFIQWRDKLLSGLGKPSLEESLQQLIQQIAFNVEKLNGMTKKFRGVV